MHYTVVAILNDLLLLSLNSFSGVSKLCFRAKMMFCSLGYMALHVHILTYSFWTTL